MERPRERTLCQQHEIRRFTTNGHALIQYPLPFSLWSASQVTVQATNAAALFG
jgi:hypothetical protein